MKDEFWCDIYCNLSLDIAREAELTSDFNHRYKNRGYSASRSETVYQIDCTCQFIKESKSSGCEFCTFLSEVIDTFIPNQTSDGDWMSLNLREDSPYIYFNPSNPETINRQSNFQGVVHIYQPTSMN